MVNYTNTYAAAIKRLWRGKCTVTVREARTDEGTGRAESIEVTRLVDEPCRISYKTVEPTESSDGASRPTQSITLLIDANVDIPVGSKIRVTQNGVTAEYERSGKAAVYSCHQEIPLELFRGWA